MLRRLKQKAGDKSGTTIGVGRSGFVGKIRLRSAAFPGPGGPSFSVSPANRAVIPPHDPLTTANPRQQSPLLSFRAGTHGPFPYNEASSSSPSAAAFAVRFWL